MEELKKCEMGHYLLLANCELEDEIKAISTLREEEFCGVQMRCYENEIGTFIFIGFADARMPDQKMLIAPFRLTSLLVEAFEGVRFARAKKPASKRSIQINQD